MSSAQQRAAITPLAPGWLATLGEHAVRHKAAAAGLGIALLAVLAFIFSTQQFTLIWLITGGGPVDATTTLAPAIYMQAFRFFNFGYAGAFAVIGFLISAVATLAFVLVQQRLAREP